MVTADTIAQKLTDALMPNEIDVQDVSHKHAGHAGWREGGGTHFEITLKAAVFANKSRLQRHRMGNAVGSRHTCTSPTKNRSGYEVS